MKNGAVGPGRPPKRSGHGHGIENPIKVPTNNIAVGNGMRIIVRRAGNDVPARVIPPARRAVMKGHARHVPPRTITPVGVGAAHRADRDPQVRQTPGTLRELS